MVQHSQNLISALIANPIEVYWNPEESLAHTGSHHWENNEFLKALSGWRDHPKGPLVWIGGSSDGQQQPLLLHFRPNIAYETPEFFTINLFQRAALNFMALWEILERLVEALSDDVYIIIDRIDQVQSDEVSQVTNDVIRSMIALANKFPQAQVLLTSVYEPPLELLSYQQAGSMEVFHFPAQQQQQGRLM
ncbi:hypothetical protein HOO65_020483 [Ceratocystis lukuohia]|uniref:Vegetative incompatibility protein HET-E-1 n=1 Tax=Ceratocystis lukuohia TaxID=2019550 RepID=A0ABR4MNV9_9PEZI